MHDCTPVIPSDAWFKSAYSGAGTSECVEIAAVEGGAAVRDSKDRPGALLAFSGPAWAGFIAAVGGGRLG
ncbi:hypothetical protein GCM10010387_53280 [Streptomyces inusitatus]|uniref:DUF397 domain-containing protein n=1 Tax=Streptomyces inusitatus TaxID=68221 RepID=A0A918QKJ9_9ACTN|nr:DUF397 domain-containing protein [Streptomyces inusitatus]GGZ52345.1 hypothetical protein GCM10010387_53280 [Streptomyces inusitatus]